MYVKNMQEPLVCMLKDPEAFLQKCLYASYWGCILFKVGANDCFRKNESDREGMLQLFCRVFITLRGSTLIMHEYMVPPTSQHFTGGEKRSGVAK